MADEIAILSKDDGTVIHPKTEWDAIENKPTGLITTNAIGPFRIDGISYSNGGYDWDHENNKYNVTYRIIDLGVINLVEWRAVFACTNKLAQGTTTTLITFPSVASITDGDNQTWYASNVDGAVIALSGNQVKICADKDIAPNQMISFTHLFVQNKK
ncbi:hypothetical protein [Ligilactobacillus equi]